MSSDSAASIPDYGWNTDAPEASHGYLQPVVIAMIDALVQPGTTQRVFDAGCGNGALLRALARSDRTIAGCDASGSGVLQARLSCSASARIEQLAVDDDMAATFGNDWDVVVATEVIEHLYSPRAFVREALRLLKPGGSLILSTPYHGYLKNLVIAASGKFDSHATALWDGGHIKFWSYRTLSTLLREFGVVDLEFRGAGRFPYLWKSMVVAGRKSAP